MVFQDGTDFVLSKGEVRVPTVFDNLIHKGDIPVTIGIFINPGRKDSGASMRTEQYVSLGDTYARFLLEEILPKVGKDYNLVDDAAGRAVCGMSDGGVGTFTVAWERPDAFSKVISHIGSYVRVPGGAEYPYLIRKTRGSPKPIRVFIQGTENDLNIPEGNWTLGNIAMASALMFARYDYRFEMGDGGHDLAHGGVIFPDALRWIWRDYPGVKGAGDAPDLDAVIGRWDVTTNTLGEVTHSVLTVTEQGGMLSATLTDEKDGKIEVMAISFKDDILSYEYRLPRSEWSKEKELKGKGSTDTMTTWLKVTGNTFEGAVAPGEKGIDYSVKGRKKGKNSDEGQSPFVGTWELTSNWLKKDEKGKQVVTVNTDLAGTVKDVEEGWETELRNAELNGDALSFSFYFEDIKDYEVDFKGTVVGKEIKGQFSIFGAKASVTGVPLSAEQAAKIAAQPSIFDIYEARSFTGFKNTTIQYRLFIPGNYDPKKKYPLVLFHHGGGGAGDNNNRNLEGECVREWILPEVQANNPCFIVAPQFPGKESKSVQDGTFSMRGHTQAIHEVLDSLEKEFSIDTNREYVTGLSFGGECTWMSLVERPDRFAAAVLICATDAYASLTVGERIEQVAQLPLWIFHGDADEVVPVEVSRKIVKALRDSGGNPRYTEYPGVNHNSWALAYRDPELVEWLFAQSRN
ncbi:MAG: alpha/beta hydrolase-fold protein [Planctomycetota bacterium]